MLTLEYSLLLLFIALANMLFRLLSKRLTISKPKIAEKCYETAVVLFWIWFIMASVAVISYF